MFYKNVKDLCAINRTNITQLAKDLGLSTSVPTKWKSGTIPRADTVQKIADHFGVSVDFLLSDSPHQMTIGNVSNSAVLQGNTGSHISVIGGGNTHHGDTQDETEQELLRIFRSLSMKGKTAVMSCLYDQEEKEGK